MSTQYYTDAKQVEFILTMSALMTNDDLALKIRPAMFNSSVLLSHVHIRSFHNKDKQALVVNSDVIEISLCRISLHNQITNKKLRVRSGRCTLSQFAIWRDSRWVL